jgi:proteasome lid subunit RPN8/RPN11
MELANAVVSPLNGRSRAADAVVMSAQLCQRIVGSAQDIHHAGLKSFGVLVAEPGTEGYPLRPVDVIFFDPRKNRRNDPQYRSAFHAQGEYFRQFEDAGFVADPRELLAAWRETEESGREIVAMFHSHRRQPPNFSVIDYRLHNPAFSWHLIISLRNPLRPELQPFRVSKADAAFGGISENDARQGSHLSYEGPEVEPLSLLVEGPSNVVDQLVDALRVKPIRYEAAAAV